MRAKTRAMDFHTCREAGASVPIGLAEKKKKLKISLLGFQLCI